MYGAALPSREPACPESHPLLKHTVALPFVLKNHGLSTDLYVPSGLKIEDSMNVQGWKEI